MGDFFEEKINKSTDWGGDSSTGGLPVSGTRVQEFIKEQLEARGGVAYYEESTNRFLVFSDNENKNLYISKPQDDLVLFAINLSCGFYECATAGSTGAKVISANYFQLTKATRIIVKMTNRNSASSVTLNIGGTGAKPVYYNGELVSSTNTWDAEELVDICYSGDAFYCSKFDNKFGSDIAQLQLDIAKVNSNAGISDSPAWRSGASYEAGQTVINPDGDLVEAKTAHSNTIYNPSQWTKTSILQLCNKNISALVAQSNTPILAVCDTPGEEAIKTITVSAINLVNGTRFVVQFEQPNTAESASLKILLASSYIAEKPIYYNNQPVTATHSWPSNATLDVVYNSTSGAYFAFDTVVDLTNVETEISKTKANTGYLECTSEGAEINKTIALDNFSLSTRCRFAIKMLHAHSSESQATLNINNTGNIALLYNDEPVTNKNTWDDNEVVDVYYSGTHFCCFAAAGGGGLGSGFFNVTTQMPLEGGYYTKDTAIAALGNTQIADEQKPGFIITFLNEDNQWEDYRFTGDTESFLTPANWNELIGNPIKTIVVRQGTSSTEKTADSEGKVYIDIPEVNVDQEINPLSTNPISNSAVYKEMENLSKQIGGALKITGGNPPDYKYRLSLVDKEDTELSFVEFFGGSGEGGVIQRIVLQKRTNPTVVKLGSKVTLDYYFDHVDGSEVSTGNKAEVTVTIISGVDSETLVFNNVSAGLQTLDISDYIRLNNNTIKVTAKVDAGDGNVQTATISWNITAVELVLTSNYNLASPIVTKGESMTVRYELAGTGSKTFKWYIDGEQVDSKVINGNSPGEVKIDTTNMSHGSHTLEMVAELQADLTTLIYSNSICLVFGVKEAGRNEPIIVTRFDFPEGDLMHGETPYINVPQFDIYSLSYAVWDPKNSKALITIEENGTAVSSVTSEFVTNTFSRRVMEPQSTIPAKIVSGSSEFSFTINIVESGLNIVDPVDGMALKLSGQGRSNSDTNYQEWTYNGITTTLSGFKWGGDGWLNNALYLTDNARATINYKPLQSTATKYDNSFALSLRFRVTKVLDDNAVVISCMDKTTNSLGVGFEITSQEILMRHTGSTEKDGFLTMKMEAGSIYDVTFVSMPIVDKNDPNASTYQKQNSGMVLMYINGILSGSAQRGAGDSIYQSVPMNISLGSNLATLELFEIRSYDNYLTSSQVLDLYILHQDSVSSMEAMYDRNNIVDGAGEITVDLVPEGMRYIVITGDYDGKISMLEHAAIINDKETKYDVEEILCVVKGNPDYNFVCRSEDGSGLPYIRLQGTSSLAYPIKNYRIYTKTQSKTLEDPVMYVGCDEQGNGGIKQEKSKYSFRGQRGVEKPAAPVNCWCLKADYAESSSSHNTGMARLASDILRQANELVPPQIHADSTYQYDIRTTVDGEPCYLFYRKTKLETPKFMGKYNFNNDKSTEEVFGFKEIPGYHITDLETENPSDWMNTLYGGKNPTECWEFSTNDSPMGNFKEVGTTKDEFLQKTDEDGKLLWNQTWEPRYLANEDDEDLWEDGTLDPVLLRTTAQWISSTDTELVESDEDKEARRQKFKNEISQYFNLNFLCDYYMFTDVFGAVDQRVKNMMLAFWHDPDADAEINPVMKGMRGYFIFYDNDTLMGVRNDGKLKYGWDIDENTIDPELNAYAYAGHDSVLWKNLRECFPDELGKAYNRLRTKMTNEVIFNIFDTEQSAKFCERVYNIDALNKYIIPATFGVTTTEAGSEVTKTYNYLTSMQGSRQSHRHWWVTNRVDQFDAKYQSAVWSAASYAISIKGNITPGMRVKAIATRNYYYAIELDSQIQAHTRVWEDNDYTWDYEFNRTVSISNASYIHGARWSKLLDFSLTNVDGLTLPAMPVLEELIIGKTENNTQSTLGSMAFSSMEMLKRLWVENLSNFGTLNLDQNTRLEEVHAYNSGVTSAVFAVGAPLTLLELPAKFSNLRLRSHGELTADNIKLQDPNAIEQLWIEGCPNIDAYSYFKELFARKSSGGKLTYVRITGLDLEGDGSELKEWYNAGLKGITANGQTSENCKIVGKYQLTNYLDDILYDKYVAYFDELEILQPKWTCVEFEDNEPDPANISNLDNQTGYKFDRPYEPSGHIKRILSLRHRVLSKHKDGMMYYFPLHDKNSYKYADAEDVNNCSDAVLDGTAGDVDMYEPRYWYKGVNDILGTLSGDGKPRKWAFISTYDEEPKLDIDFVAYNVSELYNSNMCIKGKFVDIRESSYDSLYKGDGNYAVIEMPIVEGYSMVRLPFVGSASQVGIAFLGASNILISTFSTTIFNSYNAGYVILNIPDGCRKIAFSIYLSTTPSNQEKYLNIAADVEFCNSKDPVAWEPSFVLHEECLISAFKPVLNSANKVMSCVPANNQLTTFSFNRNSIIELAKQRGRMPYYFCYKNDVENLFLLQYGTRDSQATTGYAARNSSNKTGLSATYGIQSTYIKDLLNLDKTFVYNERGEEEEVNFISTLGYENLYYVNSEAIIAEKADAGTIINEKRLVSIVSYGYQYPTYMFWQKYMSNYQCVSGGTATTYYCDQQYNGNGSNAYQITNGTSNNANGMFFRWTAGDITFTGYSMRMVYEGNLIKCSTVSEFKQIQDFD